MFAFTGEIGVCGTLNCYFHRDCHDANMRKNTDSISQSFAEDLSQSVQGALLTYLTFTIIAYLGGFP